MEMLCTPLIDVYLEMLCTPLIHVYLEMPQKVYWLYHISFNQEVWLLEYVLSEPLICKWSASKRRIAAISVPLIFVLKDGDTSNEVGC